MSMFFNCPFLGHFSITLYTRNAIIFWQFELASTFSGAMGLLMKCTNPQPIYVSNPRETKGI